MAGKMLYSAQEIKELLTNERASLPDINLKRVVTGLSDYAAEKDCPSHVQFMIRELEYIAMTK